MNIIQFTRETIFNVHETVRDVEGTINIFRAGEKAEAEVIREHRNGTVDLQFGDGSVAFSIDKTSFTQKETTLG